MEVFLLWAAFSVVVGIAASARGRSGFGWFLLSLVISPLIALILVLVMQNKAQATVPEASAPAVAANQPSEATHKKCPACAEWILREASKCKHCGEYVLAGEVAQSLATSADLDGLEEVEVVGESHYQQAIGDIDDAWIKAGNTLPLSAKLIREPNNPHDRNAVRVEIANRTVGYLPRELAERYRPAVKKHYNVHDANVKLTAPAEIRGKAPTRGVVIYLPEKFVDMLHEA